jgi:putative ABC transport system ATP-binding protein
VPTRSRSLKSVFPALTAPASVWLNGVSLREAMRRARALLEQLDLERRADVDPATLSGGEQQRLAVARAVVNDPAVILADEPTASLDTQRGKAVMDLLRQLGRERKAAVIAVTHDERMIEGFDRVYHMIDGRIDKSWRPSQPAIDGEWVVRPTGGS